MNDRPLAFFITWTVYGTFLQGDLRGWRRRRSGEQLPQLRLQEWRRERLNYPVILLELDQRDAVEKAIERHCAHRDWKLWARSCRSNHVHVVVSAPEYAGDAVRDQLKANSTRTLRETWECFRDRPVWSVGGDWQCVDSEDALEQVIFYATDAQDRMHLPKY